jgi:cbb3-type cytochrome oxidase subunit 3
MRELLVTIEATYWSQVSAIIFGCMFLVLAFWVYLPVRKSEYQRAEKLPLED